MRHLIFPNKHQDMHKQDIQLNSNIPILIQIIRIQQTKNNKVYRKYTSARYPYVNTDNTVSRNTKTYSKENIYTHSTHINACNRKPEQNVHQGNNTNAAEFPRPVSEAPPKDREAKPFGVASYFVAFRKLQTPSSVSFEVG